MVVPRAGDCAGRSVAVWGATERQTPRAGLGFQPARTRVRPCLCVVADAGEQPGERAGEGGGARTATERGADRLEHAASCTVV